MQMETEDEVGKELQNFVCRRILCSYQSATCAKTKGRTYSLTQEEATPCNPQRAKDTRRRRTGQGTKRVSMFFDMGVA